MAAGSDVRPSLWRRAFTPDKDLNYNFLSGVYGLLATLSLVLLALQYFEVADAITGFWLVVREAMHMPH
jgi:hypothetical protein